MNIHLGLWLIPTVISIICIIWAAILNKPCKNPYDAVSFLLGGVINIIGIGALLMIALLSWTVYFGLCLFFK